MKIYRTSDYDTVYYFAAHNAKEVPVLYTKWTKEDPKNLTDVQQITKPVAIRIKIIGEFAREEIGTLWELFKNSYKEGPTLIASNHL